MLRELQRSFAAAVFDEQPEFATRVLPGRFPAEHHVQIYRHNVTDTLTAALAAVYPVVERLVSPGFFGYAAHEYLRDHRPLSANLHDFGGAFADFLANFPPAADLPYLPDMARLEWAWHRAFHAADAAPFDVTKLAAISGDRLPSLQFSLHPSFQLVSSVYPIVRIFEINQEEYHGDMVVNMEEGGVAALVIRRHLTVFVEPLAAGEAALLTAFHRNRTLADALDTTLAIQPNFDINAVLADHVRRGTISGFYVN